MKLNRTVRGIIKHVDGVRIWNADGCHVRHSTDGGATWMSLPPIPLQWVRRMMSCHRLVRRATRMAIHHLLPLQYDRLLVLGFGGIHRWDPNGGRWLDLGLFRGSRPLAVARDDRNRIYYGEYHSNPERRPISIWMSPNDGDSWEVAHAFESVRHVHGVFWDPYARGLWVTTGDKDAEAALWFSMDGLRTLRQVLGGTQDFRIVQPIFTPAAVLFGSDGPDIRNHLFRFDRATGRVQKVQAVEGPVFYGTQSGSRRFLATVVEPSPVNRHRQATLWQSDDDGHSWRCQRAFRKDLLPPRLFQYGQILFPTGEPLRNQLWLTPFATEDDQISHCYEFS